MYLTSDLLDHNHILTTASLGIPNTFFYNFMLIMIQGQEFRSELEPKDSRNKEVATS